jgi:hypothetical protein
VSATDFPLGWTPRVVVATHVTARRVVMRVWRVDGHRAAPPSTLTTMPGAWTWDWSTNQLYGVSRGRIVRTDGISVTPLTRIAEFGLDRHSQIMLAPLGSGLIELATQSRLIVFDAAGRTRVDASLPAGWHLSGSIAAERTGAVAFEAVLGTAVSSRHYRLYVALPRVRPRLLDSYTTPPECGSHGLALHGSAVLVTDASGLARLYDAHGSLAPVDLAPAMRWLRVRHRSGQPRLV